METQKNKNIEDKIVKGAKGFKIATKVLYVLSAAACLAFIVLAIVLPLTKEFTTLTKAETAILFAGLALYSFFVIGLLWNAEQIFITIEQEKSPFGAKVTKYVRKTGIFVILTSIIPALVVGILVAIFAKDSEIYSGIQVGGVIAGTILYLLGYFFEYGEKLKKQDDQTL